MLRDLAADAGILVPDRDPTQGRSPRYLFLHRTFAEYLVARHLATLPTGNYLAVIAQHQWFDPDWENVIPMLGGQLSSAGARQLIAHLLASDPDPFWHALARLRDDRHPGGRGQQRGGGHGHALARK